eukprot:ctg_1014.g316
MTFGSALGATAMAYVSADAALERGWDPYPAVGSSWIGATRAGAPKRLGGGAVVGSWPSGHAAQRGVASAVFDADRAGGRLRQERRGGGRDARCRIRVCGGGQCHAAATAGQRAAAAVSAAARPRHHQPHGVQLGGRGGGGATSGRSARGRTPSAALGSQLETVATALASRHRRCQSGQEPRYRPRAGGGRLRRGLAPAGAVCRLCGGECELAQHARPARYAGAAYAAAVAAARQGGARPPVVAVAPLRQTAAAGESVARSERGGDARHCGSGVASGRRRHRDRQHLGASTGVAAVAAGAGGRAGRSERSADRRMEYAGVATFLSTDRRQGAADRGGRRILGCGCVCQDPCRRLAGAAVYGAGVRTPSPGACRDTWAGARAASLGRGRWPHRRRTRPAPDRRGALSWMHCHAAAPSARRYPHTASAVANGWSAGRPGWSGPARRPPERSADIGRRTRRTPDGHRCRRRRPAAETAVSGRTPRRSATAVADRTCAASRHAAPPPRSVATAACACPIRADSAPATAKPRWPAAGAADSPAPLAPSPPRTGAPGTAAAHRAAAARTAAAVPRSPP